jgi:hypothetical protein
MMSRMKSDGLSVSVVIGNNEPIGEGPDRQLSRTRGRRAFALDRDSSIVCALQ